MKLVKTKCTNALLIVNLSSFTKPQWVLGLLDFTLLPTAHLSWEIKRYPVNSGHTVQPGFKRFLATRLWSEAGGSRTDSLAMARS